MSANASVVGARGPPEVGNHEFRAEFPGGPTVIAVYSIVATPRRWLYALFLTPLGLWILWWNFKKLRRTE